MTLLLITIFLSAIYGTAFLITKYRLTQLQLNYSGSFFSINIKVSVYLFHPIQYSIILSTKDRYSCFPPLFEKLLVNLPNQTELIIADDASQVPEKVEILYQIRRKSEECIQLRHSNQFINSSMRPYCYITVMIHGTNYGSFHTKLDGFLQAHGEFIMSIDDDDSFDDDYYKEMVQTMEYHRNVEKDIDKYDFFITKNNFYTGYLGGRKLNTIANFVQSFHNHVAYAFRKSLLLNVEYPSHNVTILRDDAPLMIPLYIQSSIDRILFFNNTNQYRLNKYCKNVTHQMTVQKRQKEFTRNGLRFLLDLINKTGQKQYERNIIRAY